MGNLQKAALFYVLALVVFFYGYAVARFQVPPYDFLESRVQDIQAFAAGDALDKDTTLIEKIRNDTGFLPKRFLGLHPGKIPGPLVPLAIPGLNDRRTLPQMFIDDDHAQGYRVIFGAIDFEDSFWGALLIGPGGDVVHSWRLSTEHLPTNERRDHLKVMYGTHVGRDGSVTFSMQEHAGGLVKVDACGEEVWHVPGQYHHTVSSDGNGAFWTFTGTQETFDQNMVKISENTGEILAEIDMAEVREVNDNVYVWNLRNPINADWDELAVHDHMTHGNDIDPLTQELAAAFPQFEVGDLLISYASTNLVFILDPESLEVKWWRVGIADYQHDPDWEPDGRISIFNNKTRHLGYGEGYSEIVTIDPRTFESEVVYRGDKPVFRSIFNGRHELTEFGTRLITSSNQGWAFEVDSAGDLVFSFLNTYNEKESLFLSNALRLPEDYFEGEPWESCAE